MSIVLPAEDRRSKTAPYAALVVGALAMAISPVFVRLAEVGPFASAFWRVALALPALWAWCKFTDDGAAAPRQAFSRPAVLAGVLFAGDLFFWHLSIVHTTIANATFFATAAPVWVVIFGWLLFRQRVSRAVLYGLGFCVLGGAALVAQSMRLDFDRVPGDVSGIVTGIFFGLYFLAVQAARGKAGAARVTFEISLVSVVILFGIAVTLDGSLLPRSPTGWAALAGMALISHAGGQGLLSIALGRLPVAFSALVIFLEAIAAALFAWMLLGEAVTGVQACGGAAIVVGIWIARPRAATEVA